MKPTIPQGLIKGGWCLGLLLGCALMPASAEEELTEITFGLPWFAKAEHGGFFTAKATGIYAEHGLDVTIESGGPQVNNMQLLVAGKHDLTSGYPIRAITAVEEGLPVTTVATVFQKDPQVIITQPEIESLEEVKGGSILVANYADSTYWPWLESQYGFTGDMKGPYSGSIQPFVAGEVDAQQGFVTNEPYTIGKEGIDPNVFLMADLGYPPYGGTIQVTPQMLKEQPEVVEAFVQATMEGYKRYFEKPGPANELILEMNPEMSQARINYAMEKMREHELLSGGAASEKGLGTMTHERWRKTYEFMVANDLVSEDVDYKTAYTLDHLADDPAIFLD